VRTPMPWDNSPRGGFTDNEPWLPLNGDIAEKNVESQRNAPRSLLRLYRDLLALRRRFAVLSRGDYGIVESRGNILVFERKLSQENLTVMLNFGTNTVYTAFARGRILISTTGGRGGEAISNLVCLQPHEGIVVEQIESAETLQP